VTNRQVNEVLQTGLIGSIEQFTREPVCLPRFFNFAGGVRFIWGRLRLTLIYCWMPTVSVVTIALTRDVLRLPITQSLDKKLVLRLNGFKKLR
jgi:hypothetical protein